jgi:phospholipase/carboxylesterase
VDAERRWFSGLSIGDDASMQTTKLGPLNVRMFEKPGVTSGDVTPLVVVLAHGFGAPGDDLVGLAAELDAPPKTVFVFPEAPNLLRDGFGLSLNDARSWWDIDVVEFQRTLARGGTRDLTLEIPEGLADARAAFLEMLRALGQTVPLARLVIGGFSQGSMLALDVALREPELPLSGIALLSGTLLGAREWLPRMQARRGTAVFQSHGRSDAILNFAIAERLRDELGAAGLNVTFDAFAAGHTIPGSTMQRLGEWFRSLP